jgi:PST family polysaccharide transporter
MGLASKAVRGTIGFGSLNVARYGLTLISQIVLANQLTPRIFGTVTLAITFLTFLTLPMRWGIAEALVQETDHQSVFSTIFWLRVAITLPIVAIALGSSFVIDLFYDGTVVFAFLLLTVSKGLALFAAPFSGALQKHFQIFRVGSVQLVSVSIAGVVAVRLALSGESLIALVAFYAIQDVVRTVGFVILSPTYPTFSFDRSTAAWFYRFARRMWFSKILNSVESRGDDYLLGTLAGASALGAYSVAWRLAVAFKTVVQPAIDQAILPTFSQIKDSEERSTDAIEFLLRMQLYVAIPGYMVAAIVAPDLVPMMFGDQWTTAAPILSMLSITGVLAPIMASVRKFYYSRGEPDTVYTVQRYYLVTLVVAMVALVPPFGGLGGAAAVNVMSLVAVALFVRRLRQDTDFFPRRTMGPALAAGTVTGIVVGAVRYSNALTFELPTVSIAVYTGFITSLYLVVLLAVHRSVVLDDFDVVRRAVFE